MNKKIILQEETIWVASRLAEFPAKIERSC